MPSPENMQDARPVLGHVNLMVDTLIANATLNDLQAFVRTTLATSPPAVAGTFTTAARRHLAKTNAGALPETGTLFATADGRGAQPTSELLAVLARSRMLYGAGMGLAGLSVLTQVVRATVGKQWAEDSEMEDVLAAVDADLTQAIQSAKEEIDGGRVADVAAAKQAHGALLKALKDEKQDVERWGGDFPFERALSSVELWKV
ncbi:hypothetical protein TRAPUB_14264 [Trametes pubescens]|uniref:Uncharacterized protein n=1 Tax=Trametes pubescens TaxID=154538 RepID=A0A1M2VNV0_TRAPU|nr:hypothetical protein TRAPUB_14264 [Trametes pubescens]